MLDTYIGILRVGITHRLSINCEHYYVELYMYIFIFKRHDSVYALLGTLFPPHHTLYHALKELDDFLSFANAYHSVNIM